MDTDAKLRRRTRVQRVYIVFVALMVLVQVFPLFALGNAVEPRILGLPFSFAWVIFWIFVSMVGIVALYLMDEPDAKKEA